MANTIGAELAAGDLIPLGSVIRKTGCGVRFDGGGIGLSGRGYYDVDASFTLTPSAAGNITVRMLRNGVPVPGAMAAGRGGGVFPVNIAFPAIVKTLCCEGAELTFEVGIDTEGATVQLDNAAVVVEQI